MSILARETKLPFDNLQRFLNGEDDALTQDELACLSELFQTDELERFHRVTLQSETLNAVGDHLEAASVAFLFESKQGGLDVASGTLVAIGSRLFVATAGHVVHRTRMLQFIGKNFGTFEADMDANGRPTNFRGGCNLDVIDFGKSKRPDVGFFEIAPTAADILKRSPITLDRLGKATLEYGRLAFLFGYPKEYTRLVAQQSKTRNVPLCSITYPSPLLDPREWPASDEFSTALSDSTDCVVRYSPDDEFFAIVPRGVARLGLPADVGESLPEPHGTSGGGLWQSQDSESQVWSPSSMQLIAVQGSWTCDREHLRLTQIQHWLQLVQSQYPDLETEIASRLKTIG